MDQKEIIEKLTKQSYALLKANSEYRIRIHEQGTTIENPLLALVEQSHESIADSYSFLLNLDLDHLCELDVKRAIEKYQEAEKAFYLFKDQYQSVQ